jgi:hypothetical protein
MNNLRLSMFISDTVQNKLSKHVPNQKRKLSKNLYELRPFSSMLFNYNGSYRVIKKYGFFDIYIDNISEYIANRELYYGTITMDSITHYPKYHKILSYYYKDR